MSLFSRFFRIFEVVWRKSISSFTKFHWAVALELTWNKSQKFHIANMKIYEIFEQGNSDEVQFFHIYCQSNCNYLRDFFEKLQNSYF